MAAQCIREEGRGLPGTDQCGLVGHGDHRNPGGDPGGPEPLSGSLQ